MTNIHYTDAHGITCGASDVPGGEWSDTAQEVTCEDCRYASGLDDHAHTRVDGQPWCTTCSTHADYCQSVNPFAVTGA